MILSPEKHVYCKLVTTPSVARLVGFQVFPIAVPKTDCSLPFIVYKRANIMREPSSTRMTSGRSFLRPTKFGICTKFAGKRLRLNTFGRKEAQTWLEFPHRDLPSPSQARP